MPARKAGRYIVRGPVFPRPSATRLCRFFFLPSSFPRPIPGEEPTKEKTTTKRQANYDEETTNAEATGLGGDVRTAEQDQQDEKGLVVSYPRVERVPYWPARCDAFALVSPGSCRALPVGYLSR